MIIYRNANSKAHNWLIHHHLIRAVRKNLTHIQGRILDIGCGTKPFREMVETQADIYIGLDYRMGSDRKNSVDIVSDALILPFRDGYFDTVVSFQVMEHVPEPTIFLNEAYRVLKPRGVLYLSTPFMWGEHEQPRDYYRYTRYGLKYLAEKSGFEVISIEPDTGYWSTAVLRFNYAINRLAKGPVKYLLMPLWLNQFVALLLDRLDGSYTTDTATFTTILRKPS